LGLEGVQKIRWDEGGNELSDYYAFFYIYKGITSVEKKVEFVSDMMFITRRSC